MALISENPVYEFLQQLSFEQIPDTVIRQAKTCLADLIATLAAGSQTPLTSIMRQLCEQQFAAGENAPQARALSGAGQLSPAGSALVDGMVIDSMDAHDGHALTKGHVGCAVLAAINSYIRSTKKSVSGRDLLKYLVAGYEIGTRSGIVLHASCDDYHSSGAWNAVTCAALCADFLQLNREQFEHALGIAEYHGPRSQLMRDVDHPTMIKDGSGWGAMTGVSAAYMAQLGLTGAPALTVLEESAQSYWQDLGERWYQLEQYIKPYPVCRWAHPAIDAVIALRQQHSFHPDDVLKVRIHTFHNAARLAQKMPQSTDQAQYAITFPVAVALCYAQVLPQHILEAGLQDQSVREMFSRIDILEDPQLSTRFPAERLARVSIQLKQGEIYRSEPFIARGDPQNPLTTEQTKDKFYSLTRPVWGQQTAAEIDQMINQLDQPDSDAKTLFSAVRQASLNGAL